jgi:hypothetical protein
MLKTHSYNPSPAVFRDITKNLRLAQIDNASFANTLTPVGGIKLARAGAIMATDFKLLKRAVLLTAVASGAIEIYVNNPWAFAVGDALRVIAPPRTAAAVELAAITGATGASLGTISAIELGVKTQLSRITLTTPVVDNLLSININGIDVAYRIASTTVSAEIDGIVGAINNTLATCGERFRYISAANFGTYVQLASTKPYEIIEFEALLSQGAGASVGAIATSTDTGLGKITLSAPTSAALAQATKIGTVTQTPLGILDSESDLTDYPHGIAPNYGIAPVYGGQLQTKAAFYLDGQVVKALPQMAFDPLYL